MSRWRSLINREQSADVAWTDKRRQPEGRLRRMGRRGPTDRTASGIGEEVLAVTTRLRNEPSCLHTRPTRQAPRRGRGGGSVKLERATGSAALRSGTFPIDLAHTSRLHDGDSGAPNRAFRRARRNILGREAHSRLGHSGESRDRAALQCLALPRARARDRARRGDSRARIVIDREPARRPVLKPDEHRADGARSKARSRAVRGPRVLRPPRARTTSDRRPNRATQFAAVDVAGCVDVAYSGRRADRV